MRIKFFPIVSLLLLLVVITGCKKWLDVSPKTEIRERALLENEQGFKEAVTGVYILMGSGNAYGQHLTMGMLDAMGQRYNTSSTSHVFYRASRYEYSDATTKQYVATIWGTMYTCIGNINNVLTQIDAKKSTFSGNNFNIVKGEALALRALLHFDLVRLFGTSPLANGERKSIPYATAFGNKVYPLLTVNQALDSCLRDLAAAEQLLGVDKTIRTTNSDPFFSYTRNHMNYWAVKGLQARIYLYRNEKSMALAAALEVINNGSANFPFVTSAEASRTGNRDRLFANEQLFALSAYKINDYVNAYFKTTVTGGTPTLFTATSNTTALYETTTGGSSDYRFNYLFTLYGSGYSTTKYWQDEITQSSSFEYLRNLVPVIRLSEMYYIAAECAATPAEGAAYLNTVRTNRGLSALATTLTATALEAEILKEYKKETYGEGQLFFYFKRKNTARVDGSSIYMTEATWVMPLPEDEVEFANRFK